MLAVAHAPGLGPLAVGAAYLHDSEAWSERNHELARGLLETGHRVCGNVLVRGGGVTCRVIRTLRPTLLWRNRQRRLWRHIPRPQLRASRRRGARLSICVYVEGIVRGGNERESHA